MADDLRLINWSAPVTPLRLLTAQPAPAPASPPAAPVLAPDTLQLTPTVPVDGPSDWTLPGFGDQLAALTPIPVAPAPVAPVAPAPVSPKPEPKPEPKPKAPKPKPKPAPPPPPKKPPVDKSAKYAKALRSHLHGKYYKTPTGCFRYAWNLVALSHGRSIGNSTVSRAARGHSPAYLGQMAKDGRLQVGDIVYINNRPGADPTSTILSYKPHWFIYIGNGQFADQYGERDAAGMDRMFAGRKIDQIYRTN